MVRQTPVNHNQVGVQASAGVPCLLGGFCHVGQGDLPTLASVETGEQETGFGHGGGCRWRVL